MCAVNNNEEKVRTDEKIPSKRCLKVKYNIQAAKTVECPGAKTISYSQK